MTLRPLSAQWFELLTVPQELATVMECLSHTGAVELEASSHAAGHPLVAGVDQALGAYRELAHRYQRFWPAPLRTVKRPHGRLAETLESARAQLAAWVTEADPIIGELDRLGEETKDLEHSRAALRSAPRDFPDIHLLALSGPRIEVRLLELPERATLRDLPPQVLASAWQAPTSSYVLMVGRPLDLGSIGTQIESLKGRRLLLPSWLPSSIDGASAAIGGRLTEVARQRTELTARLTGLSDRLHIARALGDIALVEWLSINAKELRGSERVDWVTGWTTDLSGASLRRALDVTGAHYVLQLSAPPVGMIAPELLRNPPWARPFEVFARMLGVPGRNEADPSQLVAVIGSFIFGFMFGDVGQGLVIFVGGLALRRRFPLANILVPGGLIAAAFGVMFGSVFCRDDIIPALWIRPLAEPVPILIAGVAAGAVIISVGLVLNAIEMHWRGEARQWWGQHAGLLAAYVGLVVSPMWKQGLWVAAAGAGWYIVGAFLLAKDERLVAAATAVGSFVQKGSQILVNTVSFARIGAFALAHAGLSLAIIEIASACGPFGYWIALVLGNALVIVLEGLVVSIQTTRLLLFEFFIRFLIGTGREFKALQPPAGTADNVPAPKLRSTL